MKGGMVVQIRISPKDCLGILDCAEVAGVDTAGKSFASIASITFSSLIALARQTGIITSEEDGFQYLNRMQQYNAGKATKQKRQYTDNLYQSAVLGKSPPQLVASQTDAMRQLTSGHGNTVDNIVPSIDAVPEVKEIEGVSVTILMQELQSLMDIQDGGSTLTKEQQNRYNHLNTVLFS